MHGIVLLANSAQSDASGTVHALGLGWTQTGTPLGQHAVVVFVELEAHEQQMPHELHLEMVDDDGHLISFGRDDTTGNLMPLVIEGTIHELASREETPCTTVTHAMAFNISAGMALTTDTRYEWRLDVDRGFLTRRSFTVVGA